MGNQQLQAQTSGIVNFIQATNNPTNTKHQAHQIKTSLIKQEDKQQKAQSYPNKIELIQIQQPSARQSRQKLQYITQLIQAKKQYEIVKQQNIKRFQTITQKQISYNLTYQTNTQIYDKKIQEEKSQQQQYVLIWGQKVHRKKQQSIYDHMLKNQDQQETDESDTYKNWQIYKTQMAKSKRNQLHQQRIKYQHQEEHKRIKYIQKLSEGSKYDFSQQDLIDLMKQCNKVKSKQVLKQKIQEKVQASKLNFTQPQQSTQVSMVQTNQSNPNQQEAQTFDSRMYKTEKSHISTQRSHHIFVNCFANQSQYRTQKSPKPIRDNLFIKFWNEKRSNSKNKKTKKTKHLLYQQNNDTQKKTASYVKVYEKISNKGNKFSIFSAKQGKIKEFTNQYSNQSIVAKIERKAKYPVKLSVNDQIYHQEKIEVQSKKKPKNSNINFEQKAVLMFANKVVQQNWMQQEVSKNIGLDGNYLNLNNISNKNYAQSDKLIPLQIVQKSQIQKLRQKQAKIISRVKFRKL